MQALLAVLLTVVAPTNEGLVLGSTVEVEIKSGQPPATVTLDGASVAPSGGWTALPYSDHHVGRFALAKTGQHDLAIGSTTIHFESVSGSPVPIGDLAAKHFLAAKPTTTQAWDWGPGVFLHGLHRFAEVSPLRTTYLDAIESYYAHWMQQGIPKIERPDQCTPGLAALALARDDSRTSALPAAKKVADYVKNEPRNKLGAIDHLGAHSLFKTLAILSIVLEPWAHSIWCDSLQMYAVFSAQWGHTENDQPLLDFGAAQPVIFGSLLQDPVNGLFTHAWDEEHAKPLGVQWLRGNGWAAASTLDILDEIPQGHPKRASLERIARDHLKGLAAKQMANGLWDSIASNPGASYAEASGSALAAYALAKGERLGLAPKGSRQLARHAFEAIVSRMEKRPDGYAVAQVSGSTDPTPWWIYVLIPRGADKDYGTGAFLMLTTELEKERW
jgi:unsaturated rhamnogalacturonyl hydrolase